MALKPRISPEDEFATAYFETLDYLECLPYDVEQPRVAANTSLGAANSSSCLETRNSTVAAGPFITPALCSISSAFFTSSISASAISSSSSCDQIWFQDSDLNSNNLDNDYNHDLNTEANNRNTHTSNSSNKLYLEPSVAHCSSSLQTLSDYVTTLESKSTQKPSPRQISDQSLSLSFPEREAESIEFQLTSNLLQINNKNNYSSSVLSYNTNTHTHTYASVNTYPNSNSAYTRKVLIDLSTRVPKKICQYPFKKNDIVWVCRTCQADETCVLCHDCFKNSNHENHDVSFYHAGQAGGCCDCGDQDAWNPHGFCSRHGKDWSSCNNHDDNHSNIFSNDDHDTCDTHSQNHNQNYSQQKLHTPKKKFLWPDAWGGGDVSKRCEGIVSGCITWILQKVITNIQEAHTRTNFTINDQISSSTPSHTNHHLDKPMESYDIERQENDELYMMRDSIFNNLDGDLSSNLFDSDILSLVFKKKKKHRWKELEKPSLSIKNDPLLRKLGHLGMQQNGLYLVLHFDDVHTIDEYVFALATFYTSLNSTPSRHLYLLCERITKLLKRYGDIIILGTNELLSEVGLAKSNSWKRGEDDACQKVGSLILEKANIFINANMVVCIKTHSELCHEVRAKGVLEFLHLLSDSCDPIASHVSSGLIGVQKLHTIDSFSTDINVVTEGGSNLISMLRCDLKLPRNLSNVWHSLLLTLLSIPQFKSALSDAYCITYKELCKQFGSGVGVLDKSMFNLGVQFLNRGNYVQDLVKEHNFLGHVAETLFETFSLPLIDTRYDTHQCLRHPVFAYRRYLPCISDMKCILNIPGMAKLFFPKPNCQSVVEDHMNSHIETSSFLDMWISSLSMLQNVDSIVWRSRALGHVEFDKKTWISAFNTSISLGNLFERLLKLEDGNHQYSFSVQSESNFLNAIDIGLYVLKHGLIKWQDRNMSSFTATSNSSSIALEARCPVKLPMSTVSRKYGSPLAFKALPLSQVTPWSFHLPLHRWFSQCVKEISNMNYDFNSSGIEEFLSKIKNSDDNENNASLYRGMIEFPAIILSRAAQIRAGFWKRNGNVLEQVLNYSEAPLCRTFRDTDLNLMQFGYVGCYSLKEDHVATSANFGCAQFFHLLLHRFGLYDYVGFLSSPLIEKDDFHSEEKEGSKKVYENDLTFCTNVIDDASMLQSMLEDFLQLLIIFITELPSPPPQNKSHHILQAKDRLKREVIHKLASGPKTHSELSEVYHVLPLPDTEVLNEEGKLLDANYALGGILEATLKVVANCSSSTHHSQGKPEADKWELNNEAWNHYDPAFFHTSLANHQNATEKRQTFLSISTDKVHNKPFAPKPPESHHSYTRIRLDVTSDASLIALLYKILLTFCGYSSSQSRALKFVGEVALARVIHLLTIGCYTWDIKENSMIEQWSGDNGSIFYSFNNPTLLDWTEKVFFSDPEITMASESYRGYPTLFMLLKCVAAGEMNVQDKCICSGSSWLCDFAMKNSHKAMDHLCSNSIFTCISSYETDRKGKEARERAVKRMKEQMAKFSNNVDHDNFDDSTNDHSAANINKTAESGFGLHFMHFRCIICGDSCLDSMALCGYIQASTVLKKNMRMSSEYLNFASTHVSLCGHIVHITCTDFKKSGRHEFSCPMCRRFSNCLIPFTNFPPYWIHHYVNKNSGQIRNINLEEYYDADQKKRITKVSLSEEWEIITALIAAISYNVDIKCIEKETLDRHIYEEFRDIKSLSSFSNSSYVDESNLEFSEFELVTKVFSMVESFAYSCCSEACECKRMLTDSYSADVCNMYGVKTTILNGYFLVLPESATKSCEGSSFIFDGRIGRLRYLALSIMKSAALVSSELIPISMSFPRHKINESDENSIVQTPTRFPILAGHILTHLVAGLVSVIGKALFENSIHSTAATTGVHLLSAETMDRAVCKCEDLLVLGFLGRILQVLLGFLQEQYPIQDEISFETKLYLLIDNILHSEKGLTSWTKGCCIILKTAIKGRVIIDNSFVKMTFNNENANAKLEDLIFKSSEIAKEAALSFLSDASVILQILLPGWTFKKLSEHHDSSESLVCCNYDHDDGDISATLFKSMTLLGIQPLDQILESPNICQIMSYWYQKSPQLYRVDDWPCIKMNANEEGRRVSSKIVSSESNSVPLFRGSNFKMCEGKIDGNPCVDKLAVSYTDLYAEIVGLCPDIEQVAVCLLCGALLDAGGKGNCTKHIFRCSGGCGVFFLLQDCICLMLHDEKAMYTSSLYVDSHGETPQFRGRPLNLELSRYNRLYQLWSGHLLRQEVMKDSSRNPIPANWY